MPNELDDRTRRSLTDRVTALEKAQLRSRNAFFFVLEPKDPNADEIPADRLAELQEFFRKGLARQQRRKNMGKEIIGLSWKLLVPLGATLLGALNPTIGKFIQNLWKGIIG